jgi:uncharacterized protein with ParB-like and HNH nuclease domain
MKSNVLKELLLHNEFKIPPYQRSYSWEEKQIEQFIDDIKIAKNSYYLGHFLFEKNSKVLQIIDGQQRLTTCFIFFYSLKHALKSRKELECNDNINIILNKIEDYLIVKESKINRFSTVEYDNNFFIEEIKNNSLDNPITTSSQNRIRKAKEIFDNELKQTSTEELLRWFDLIQTAVITQYIVKDKTQAAQIFAFQNDRGKSLSKLDILKSFFILQIYLESENSEQIEENIKYVENSFVDIYKDIVDTEKIVNEDDVLTYYWRSYSNKGYYADEVVKDVKNTLKDKDNKIDWIKEFVNNVQKAFKAIKKLKGLDDSYVKNLFDLNNMALSYPYFIKAIRVGCNDKTLIRLAHFLENITFRNLLRGGRAEVEYRLNNYLINSNTNDEINEGITKMIENIKTNEWWGYWNDNEMIRNLNSGWFYRNRVDNYLLWKYEQSLAQKGYSTSINISFDKLIKNESIEHIAPQTPTNGDPVANGYGDYDDKENPENGIVSGEWLHCVGNLMLISREHNSSIGNKPFIEKLNSYGECNLLNQQKEIIDFVENKEEPIWDKCAIEKRRNRIVDAAIKIWSLDNI